MIQSRALRTSFNRAICLLARMDCLLISPPQISLNNYRSVSCQEMRDAPTANQPKSIFTNHIRPYGAILEHYEMYPVLDYFYSAYGKHIFIEQCISSLASANKNNVLPFPIGTVLLFEITTRENLL